MDITQPIAALIWDPTREAFTIPWIDRPVFWYGILFVSGFILCYFILNPILTRFILHTKGTTTEQASPQEHSDAKKTAYLLTDKMCWFAVIGTVVGARLGDVFFYSWSYFREHPMEIFMVWNGGLASHGGVLGLMLALYIFTIFARKTIPQLTFLRLIDYVAVVAPLASCFIRLGNFMNQEIVGTPTSLPWGVLFVHPAELVTIVPRHPVQLYESIVYFLIFIVLWKMWKREPVREKPGTLVGLMFILIFGSRFILEFWKAEQESSLAGASWLQMGQILSIPFILLGFFLFLYSNMKSSSNNIEIHL